MARLAGFRLAHGNGAHVRVEVESPHPYQLAITAPREQSGLNEIAEGTFAGIDEAPAFVLSEIAHHGRVYLAERLHFPPGFIGCHAAFMEGMIKSGFQDRQRSIGGWAGGAPGVVVVGVDLLDLALFVEP